jgi:hypothetical protein
MTHSNWKFDNSSTKFKISDILPIFRSSLFFTFLSVMLVSLILLACSQYNTALIASSQNFVGIFSSVFVHKDIWYLASNMGLAFMTLLLYSFSSALSGHKKYLSMSIVIWLSTIIATLIYIILNPSSEVRGSSGLVSAFLGGATAFAFLIARKETALAKKFGQLIIAIILLSTFIVFNTGVSPDTNIFVHLVSFFLAMFSLFILNRKL